MSQANNQQSSSPQPELPLPPPILSNIPGTWAHSTTTVRLPQIARRTLIENEFPPVTAARVEALIGEIPQSPIRLLRQEGAPDAAAWAADTGPYLGLDWREPPWFFVETYFYRRLLEATGYFSPGPGERLDPFAYQKKQGLVTTRQAVAAIATQLGDWLEDGWQETHFAALLHIALWGNRADLSLWPAGAGEEQPHAGSWQEAEAFTLANDAARTAHYLTSRQGVRVDILVDNAGLELVSDLALAHYLLACGTAVQVTLHLKMHPTFVSDAMAGDVLDTAAFLATEENTAVAHFGRALLTYLEDRRLRLVDHPFWVSPRPFWAMPAELRQSLSRSGLIISKGDANYRRLLGDRQWPYTTPFAEILSYTPAPLLALRALKAELAAGLQPEQITHLNEVDPDWLVNGRWGVMQFVPKDE